MNSIRAIVAAVLRALAPALLLLGGLKMAQAATVKVPLNGLMVTLDSACGAILRLEYPGVGVLLQADVEEAGLVDVAYPLPDFEPLRLAARRSSGADIQQSPSRVIVRIPALGATRHAACQRGRTFGHSVVPNHQRNPTPDSAGYAETSHFYAKPGQYLVKVEHVSADGIRALARLQVRVGVE